MGGAGGAARGGPVREREERVMSQDAFTKVVSPGSVPNGNGRMDVFVKIEWDGTRLSISGVEGPLASGNASGSCGQIDGGYAHRDPVDDDRRYQEPTRPEEFSFRAGWDAEHWLDFLDVWKRWHLNDMQAGCEHQRADGWAELGRREVTLYHWRLKSDVSATVRAALKTAEKGLRAGETVTLEPEVAELAALPYEVTTSTAEVPDERYEPRNELYPAGRGPTETKALGWLRPGEHPDGILTRPCPVCGYAYGSAWQTADVPDEALAFLRGLPETSKTPAWV